MKLRIEQIGDRKICIGGVGTLFHQDGLPIGMSARQLQNMEVELSWFHVVRELYYQYTSNERLFAKIKAEVEDAKAEGIFADLAKIEQFIYADYETQNEMIFDYLFCGDIETAKDFVRGIV